MTLVLAWIRKVGITEELCVASDSRVTSGKAWDCCPKIKLLDRGDSIMAFAGNTAYAYPMMEQISNSIKLHPINSLVSGLLMFPKEPVTTIFMLLIFELFIGFYIAKLRNNQ